MKKTKMKNKIVQIDEEKIREYILEFNRRAFSPEKGFKHISGDLSSGKKICLDDKVTIIQPEKDKIVLPQAIVDTALTYKSGEQTTSGLELVIQSMDNVAEGIYPYLIVSSAQMMKEALDLAKDTIQNMYVEDLFMAGYSAKVRLEKEIKKLFESKIRKYQKEVAFIIDHIKQTPRYKLLAGIDQDTYSRALDVLNDIISYRGRSIYYYRSIIMFISKPLVKMPPISDQTMMKICSRIVDMNTIPIPRLR